MDPMACVDAGATGRNKYTFDVLIEMSDSDYGPYNEPWWGTLNWSPNMQLSSSGLQLSLRPSGEERFSIMPGETHTVIGVDAWLEPIMQGSTPTAANTAFFRASAYLPARRVTAQSSLKYPALPSCSIPHCAVSCYGGA